MKTPIAILTADIHARNTAPRCRKDDFMAAQCRKLEWIRANMPEGVPWLDAGDLFHSWKSAPETEIMLLEVLNGIEFYSIPGNHEIPYHNQNRLTQSSFQVLCAAGVIKTEKMAPCPSGFYAAAWISISGVSVLILHGMVWPDTPIMSGIDGISALDLMRAYSDFDVDVILTGHNHQTFVVEQEGRILVNPGSIMRSAIDQIDHKPCVFILYDDKTVEQVFIPIEDDVFAEDVYQKQHDHADRLQAFLERVQDTEGFSESFEKNLDVYCQRNNVGEEVRKEISRALEKNND